MRYIPICLLFLLQIAFSAERTDAEAFRAFVQKYVLTTNDLTHGEILKTIVSTDPNNPREIKLIECLYVEDGKVITVNGKIVPYSEALEEMILRQDTTFDDLLKKFPLLNQKQRNKSI